MFRGRRIPIALVSIADIVRLELSGALFVPLLFFLWPPAASICAGDDVTVARIVDAWQRQQEELDSCVIEWTQHRVYGPGSVIAPSAPDAASLPDPVRATGIPTKRVEFDFRSSLKIKGDWMRYQTTGLGVTKEFDLEPQAYVSSYDGESSRLLFAPTDPAPDRCPSGSICNESRNTDSPSYPLRPLLCWLRPLDRSYTGIDASRLLVVHRDDARIGDTSCLVVRHGQDELWVAPSQPFAILRWYEHHPRGRINLQFDIKYQLHAGKRRLPTGWTVKRFKADGSGDVDESIEANVVRADIDVSLTKDAFRLEFPIGACVYDHIKNEEFIVRKDGSRRIIHPGEFGRSPDELLQADRDPPDTFR